MSADSPCKASKSLIGKTVLPGPVVDRSIIDSVTGFIQDVVPHGYSNIINVDNREKILWTQFETLELNEFSSTFENDESLMSGVSPMLLTLGYGFGVQVWYIGANGEAYEVLSWSQGVVKILKFIPSPILDLKFRQDPFAHKRPLIALCDGSGPGPQFCSISFVSLTCGDVVKTIKFKNPIMDIAVNHFAIAIVFLEKIAIFDALTVEDIMTITTCYPSPGIKSNPIALGTRWLAYADQKVISWNRSLGGYEGENGHSYTATVLHAAKTLSQSLRDLSGSVANSITGVHNSNSVHNISLVNESNQMNPGIITVIDIKNKLLKEMENHGPDIVAHFIAHCEAIVALNFDQSGLMLVTADKNGHRFNVFKINPNVLGSPFASVHHLYTLHRGDTTAKIQDIQFSSDSRWVAVSSLRGTTHLFPITPYGGPIGLRTHSTPHIVNKLSRFHRSAGLISDGRNSPVLTDSLQNSQIILPYSSPCINPAPHPIVIQSLNQIRSQGNKLTSDEVGISTYIRLSTCFAHGRVLDTTMIRDISNLSYNSKKTVADSLYVMTSNGILTQYDMFPVHSNSISKEKIFDDTMIELNIEPKTEWNLYKPPLHATTVNPPLNRGNPLLDLFIKTPFSNVTNVTEKNNLENIDERWLSQVEISTHAGPHRRLWMGPQFSFKTCNTSILGRSDSDTQLSENENGPRLVKSSPVSVPQTGTLSRQSTPVFIECGSNSSFDYSPKFLDLNQGDSSDFSSDQGETKILEDLAEAMNENLHINKAELSETETIDEGQFNIQPILIKRCKKAKKKRNK
ncbi:breast carcinoma-amplified sequence 3 homolog isoform X2 [Daktulosphaira vitifoliae]|uniref:breast carcinoma-amplified sequence 3 homolog isoform X2 n=1 Tax=Daktulosphaira vitifoliae TaxID=58002 RepID=UPI0021A9A2AC|nr:breast carcinoma-amplified sequence 3 homolog isoform X2 [Daktulosphaira vitifoliae]